VNKSRKAPGLHACTCTNSVPGTGPCWHALHTDDARGPLEAH
jgi:hypothetical protein